MDTVLAHGGHVVPTASVSTAVVRWVVLLVAAAVVAALLRRSRTAPAIGVSLVAGVVATSATSWGLAALQVTHRAAAALWLGAVGAAVLQRSRRPTRTAVAAALVMAGTGLVLARLDRVGLDPTGPVLDRIVLLKGLLLLVAAGLGVTRHHGRELVALGAAASLGSVLLLTPGNPAPGRPLLSAADGTRVDVVPQRPGTNLVRVDLDRPVRVNGTWTSARAGATGQWAAVELPSGRSTLEVDGTPLLVDTGSTRSPVAPDGPECAAVVARGGTACPSEQLTRADARALTALVDWLRARGQVPTLVGDDSPRSRQTAQLLGDPRGNGPVLLTGTWDSADRELSSRDRLATPGLYLAPWLLTGKLLSVHATAAPFVVLPFDPYSPAAETYLQRAGVLAAGSAYDGPESTVRVFATTPSSVFPSELGHGHASGGWFPGGRLTAVSGPL